LPPLRGDLSVDTVVVGGGIVGLTTAYLLGAAGQRVALLDSHRIAGGESGRSTAHLCDVLDTRYFLWEERLGSERTAEIARAARAGIDTVRGIIAREGIECGFAYRDGFLFAETDVDLEDLDRELEAARRAGLSCDRVGPEQLPFPSRGAGRFACQAQIDPVAFLHELRDRVLRDGTRIYENCEVLAIDEDKRCSVLTRDGRIRSRWVVLATGVPPAGRLALGTRLLISRTYAIAVRARGMSDGAGLYWDMRDPYHYLRRAEPWGGGEPCLLVGGEDHRTGTYDHTEKCVRRLRVYARDLLGDVETIADWSGQIVESPDGLPYVGLAPGSHGLLVATAFAGQGMSLGVTGAELCADFVLERKSGWQHLFRLDRLPWVSLRSYLTDGIGTAYRRVAHRWRVHGDLGFSGIPPGEGRVLRVGEDLLAVYRSDDFRLSVVRAACPEQGDVVHWNRVERSWDCPGCGSRFSTDGQILNGPAVMPLAEVDIDDRITLERLRQGENIAPEAA
jgi:glycine/D-amino acid oxidase-like deaminating enzyme